MFESKKSYAIGEKSTKWPKRIVVLFLSILAIIVIGMVGVRLYYNASLQPISSEATSSEFVVDKGATVKEVGDNLQEKGLIKSSLVFQLYLRSKQTDNPLIAGTYSIQPSLSVQEIASILSKGKVATDLITILPGQRIDQIKEMFINSGFTTESVDEALDPRTYDDNPALVDLPDGVSLEGYLYPESFQKTATTQPKEVVEASLKLMNEKLSPEVRSAFAKHGLSVYQGIVLASIVEQEAYRQQDRTQIAQVFLTRLNMGMPLQSDPTAKYGAILDGEKASLTYVSAYNTYTNGGLPPTPISNVSASSLQAVAKPASTKWVYFVAGDDGTVHYSSTLQEHEALTKRYCTKLCGY